MNNGKENGWLQLTCVSNWGDEFFLDKQKIGDVLKECEVFDVKISDQTFEACRIRIKTHDTRGLGGMSEDSSSSEIYAKTQKDIEIKLPKTGKVYLRKNPLAHKAMDRKRKKKNIETALAKLRLDRTEIDKNIRKRESELEKL